MIIDNSIIAATFSRCLIFGKHQAGLDLADARGGDKLCLIEGGKMPFVVRKHNHGDQNRRQYEVIGENVMDGGAAQLNTEWRDFTLV